MKSAVPPFVPACRLDADTLARRILTALQQGKAAEAVEPALVLAGRYGHALPDAEALCATTLSRAGHEEAALEHWDKALHRDGLNAARLAQALRAARAIGPLSPAAARYAACWLTLLEHLFTDVPDPAFLEEMTQRGWRGRGCVGIHAGRLRGWLWLPTAQTYRILVSGGPSFSLEKAPCARQGLHTLHVLNAPLPETTTPFSLGVIDDDGRHVQGSPLQCSPAAGIASCAGRATPRRRTTGEPTVIIPVYDDRAATLSCLASVFLSRKKNRTPFKIFILWDHGPDKRLYADLRRLAARRDVVLRETPHNLGFLAGINYALSLVPQGDVVLLNADTLVSGDWIDRMARALRRPDTGTVTALGSDAELMSFPSPSFRGDVRRLREARRIDEACRLLPPDTALREIPVGVGFCMGIARRALQAVGGFDGLRLFSGYGEEVDFCLRVAESGLKNFAAMNIFVAHLGGRSFGMAKRALATQNNAAIFARHPGYDAAYDAFMAADPLASLRDRISRTLCGPFPEGTRLHVFSWTDRRLPPLSARRLPSPYAALFVLPFPAGGARMLLRLRQDVPLADMRFRLPEDREALQDVLERCRLETAVLHGELPLARRCLRRLPLRLEPSKDVLDALPRELPTAAGSCLALPPHGPAAWGRLCGLARRRPGTRFFVFTLPEQLRDAPCPANVRPLPFVRDLSPLDVRTLLVPSGSATEAGDAWRAWLSDHGCADAVLRALPNGNNETAEMRS